MAIALDCINVIIFDVIRQKYPGGLVRACWITGVR